MDNEKRESENIIDPRLRFDAFTAGIKEGGLRSVASINLIVCYIIANIKAKVTAQNIIDTMDEGMIANHFEVSNAISKLKSQGVISENRDGSLELNGSDKAMIDLVEKDLPLTLRDKSIKICQRLIAKETYQRENKAEITTCDGGYNVTLHVSDKNNDFMSLTLFAATLTQAEVIKEKFITNPVRVYENLIDSIFSNED
ncbi:MAG: DUF4364 family protein [Eubacterium sp.]